MAGLEAMSDSKAKEKAKERDNYTCRFCDMDNSQHKQEFGRGIHAHHILKDSDGGVNNPRNLITVCRNCHKTLEKTHADAISVLRENILTEVEKEYVPYEGIEGIVSDALDDKIMEDKDCEKSEKVNVGYHYYHQEHGIVCAEGFDTQVVSADVSGVNEKVVVKFMEKDSIDSISYKEPISTFQDKTRYGSQYSTDVEKKVEQFE